MDNYLTFAKKLALQAGSIILQHFRQSTQVSLKPDGSHVTAVDIAINLMVVNAVKNTYPDHGVMGEEIGAGDGNEKYQWICDPLDGTVAFILGIPNSMFMLALVKEGVLVLSVVCDPFTERLYWATQGKGAYCNEQPLHVSCKNLRGGIVVIGSRVPPGSLGAIKSAGATIEAVSVTGYKCMLVATGKAEAFVYSGSHIHDIAAPALIVAEAGGHVTDFKGNILHFDKKTWSVKGVLFSNNTAYAPLVEIMGRMVEAD